MSVSMRSLIRALLLRTPIYRPVRNFLDRGRDRRAVATWQAGGGEIPPPHAVKQAVLRKYARRHRLRVLVETGTYYGEMVHAMTYAFRRIHSIELSASLCRRAQERFGAHEHIEIICGDSAQILPYVLQRLAEPALFWLDGHYSGGETARGQQDTPIVTELEWILASPKSLHVIVIDDARCFGTDPGYPTLDELRQQVVARRPDLDFEVSGDSIRITPR
jgi:hypothetical protein